MDTRLKIYNESILSEKIKKLEKEQEKRLDIDNLNKVFFVRCDGISFKNFTHGFKKPFDEIFREAMYRTMFDLCNEIQGSCIGFTQSDEITVMFKKKSETSNIIYGGRVNKINTKIASFTTLRFNINFKDVVEEFKRRDKEFGKREEEIEEEYTSYVRKFFMALFDARVFEIDINEELEPFIWRCLDCYKNAVQMIARANYSHKQLHEKGLKDMEEMLLEKDIKLDDFSNKYLYGRICVKEPVLLYEGTNRECTRNKFVEKDVLDFLF